MAIKKAAALAALGLSLTIISCFGGGESSEQRRQNADTVAGKAGAAAHTVSKEGGKAARAAGKKMGEAARRARDGWQESARKDRQKEGK